MTRYSDPFICPDCHARLPVGCLACPECDLPLQGPLAMQLFRTLQNADAILVQLRASRSLVPPVPGPLAAPRPTGAVSPARRRGVRVASVPTLLLGLGALCLLVAAVTFLAVAWSWLGVGGRTAVLVALTVASGGAGTWLGVRALRVAGEALTTVSLGLLVLDVVGADNAGWLGHPGVAAVVCVVGAALGGASLALTFAPPRLVVPQLGAGAGLWLVVAGALELDLLDTHVNVTSTAGVVAFAGLTWLARRRRLPVLVAVGSVGAGTWWLALFAAASAEAADHAGLRGMWLEGHGWPLLVASALVLLPAAFNRSRPWVLLLCGAGAAALATTTIALPAADEGASVLTTVALLCLVGWTAVARAASPRLRPVCFGPMGLAALPVAAVSVGLLVEGAATVLGVGDPFTRGVAVQLHPTDLVASPALLVPSLLGLVAAAAVASPSTLRASWPWVALVALVVGATGSLALLPVALWTVVAAVALLAVAVLADAWRRTGDREIAGVAAALVLAAGAVVAALPSELLTAVASTVLAGLAGAAAWRGTQGGSRSVGRAVAPAALALAIWCAAGVADVPVAHRGLPILLVLGALALLLPVVEVELSAAVSVLASSAVAVGVADDVAWSLAVHLTVAGVLVSASALKNPGRRELGWLGGALLALATWVRLADLGVGAPEAYTLPSALALLTVGLHRLWRTPEASTWVALGPALALATTPSLLWVLAGEPVSVRAALLGVACLLLVLAGARLRWNAPLLVGSVVGGLLVLRELAPYAAATPQWVLIGLAGTVLTVVGVTWERRVRDLHQATVYLGRLR